MSRSGLLWVGWALSVAMCAWYALHVVKSRRAVRRDPALGDDFAVWKHTAEQAENMMGWAVMALTLSIINLFV